MAKTPPVNERFVVIKWSGPFGYGQNGLVTSTVDANAPTQERLQERLAKSGLYLALGDHPSFGERALLYIGRSKLFGRRLNDDHEWLAEESRVEVYLGELSDPDALEDVEKLLIHAHSPPYCAQSISSCQIRRPLRVWNDGQYWRLFPEVSSGHPWYPDVTIKN